MELDLAIESERDKARHMVALFLGLAVLVERACGRAWVLRFFLLWALRPAEAIALRYIAEAHGASGLAAFAEPQGDNIAKARRLARCFRAAARVLAGTIARCRISRGLDCRRSHLAEADGHPVRLMTLGSQASLRPAGAPAHAVVAIDSS